MERDSSLLTFSQVLPLENMKQLEFPLAWKLPMAPAGNTPWPKAWLYQPVLSADLPTPMIVLEMNLMRKNGIWLVTSLGRVSPVMHWGRVGSL